MGGLVKGSFSIVRVAVVTVFNILDIALGAPGVLWYFFVGISDFILSRWAMRGGVLHCPKGHEIETEGVYECTACGFSYQGSAWICRNPECGSHTPFTNCPTCERSVRNPYRWGRP